MGKFSVRVNHPFGLGFACLLVCFDICRITWKFLAFVQSSNIIGNSLAINCQMIKLLAPWTDTAVPEKTGG